jgi:ribosomal protein S18 acetylase RimI-like enzyme
VVLPVATVVAVAAGADKQVLGHAAWLASVPLWFLLAYLALVVLTPWLHVLHRRAGLAVAAAMVIVAVADVLRRGLDVPIVGQSTGPEGGQPAELGAHAHLGSERSARAHKATSSRPTIRRSTNVPAGIVTPVCHRPHLLDNPAHAALAGPHVYLAERQGTALRYPTDVAPYAGLPEPPGPGDWTDLATLAGERALVRFAGTPAWAPEGWAVTRHVRLQMISANVTSAQCADAVRLTTADVPEMLDLVARTDPGPFLPCTTELGTYLGIRRNGTLVAMAGERLHPPGWTEISAVCTRVEYRGKGLARQLVLALTSEIHSRGESAFLHVSADNSRAIGLYESLGFEPRRLTTFIEARVPTGAIRAAIAGRVRTGEL